MLEQAHEWRDTSFCFCRFPYYSINHTSPDNLYSNWRIPRDWSRWADLWLSAKPRLKHLNDKEGKEEITNVEWSNNMWNLKVWTMDGRRRVCWKKEHERQRWKSEQQKSGICSVAGAGSGEGGGVVQDCGADWVHWVASQKFRLPMRAWETHIYTTTLNIWHDLMLALLFRSFKKLTE